MSKTEKTTLAFLLIEHEAAKKEYIKLWQEVVILCDALEPRLLKIRELRKNHGFTPEMFFGCVGETNKTLQGE